MKKILLSTLFLSSLFTAQGQTTLFEDSFETYTDFAITNVGNWTIKDMDNAQYNYVIQATPTVNFNYPNAGIVPAFIVFNRNTTTPSGTASENLAAKTGNKFMAAFASYNRATPQAQPTPVTQSDWLISPKIALGSEGNVVKFWAKSNTIEYGAERFKVLISTTNTTPTSFTAISTGNYIAAANTTWTEYSYNIPTTYNSQEVYIAIQCVSFDSFIFMVDDFKVTTTGTATTEDFFKENFSLYPNPTKDILNITSKNGLELNEVKIIDLAGRVIKTEVNNNAINVSDLASGTYIIDIKSNEGRATSKFIKR